MLRAECDEIADWGVIVALDIGPKELATCAEWETWLGSAVKVRAIARSGMHLARIDETWAQSRMYEIHGGERKRTRAEMGW